MRFVCIERRKCNKMLTFCAGERMLKATKRGKEVISIETVPG